MQHILSIIVPCKNEESSVLEFYAEANIFVVVRKIKILYIRKQFHCGKNYNYIYIRFKNGVL